MVILVDIFPMEKKDLQEIMVIERASFIDPWSKEMFLDEFKNKLSYFLVAKFMKKVVGYGGFWLIFDEAHLVNLAISPYYRRKKFGEQLLDALLKLAVFKAAKRATLEVRQSNQAAQNFYQKFGFKPVAIRKKYYQDNREDALIMWHEHLIDDFGERDFGGRS
ncbi:ribosomal protein S18-alanine N-acetyltransferase [bacterium]|nr:ribosomal protein S18-alanine N-acetyltransferase [bacterium]